MRKEPAARTFAGDAGLVPRVELGQKWTQISSYVCTRHDRTLGPAKKRSASTSQPHPHLVYPGKGIYRRCGTPSLQKTFAWDWTGQRRFAKVFEREFTFPELREC